MNAEHYPLIFPVNYALDRDVIVVRTHAGTMLEAAAHANVTFEVDEIDRRTRTGWSVLPDIRSALLSNGTTDRGHVHSWPP